MFAQLLSLFIALNTNTSLKDAETLDNFKFYLYKNAETSILGPVIPRVINHSPNCLVAYDSILSKQCPTIPFCGKPKRFVYSSTILEDRTFCYHTKLLPGALDVPHLATGISFTQLDLSADTYSLSSLPNVSPNNKYVVLHTDSEHYAITSQICFEKMIRPNDALPHNEILSFIPDKSEFRITTNDYSKLCHIHYVPQSRIYQHFPLIVTLTNSGSSIKGPEMPVFLSTDTPVQRLSRRLVLNTTIGECFSSRKCPILINEEVLNYISIPLQTITFTDTITSALLTIIDFIFNLFLNAIISTFEYLLSTHLGLIIFQNTLFFLVILSLFLLTEYTTIKCFYFTVIVCLLSNTLKLILNDSLE